MKPKEYLQQYRQSMERTAEIEQHRGMFTTDRARNRAKTFEGVAQAMAEQWGGIANGT